MSKKGRIISVVNAKQNKTKKEKEIIKRGSSRDAEKSKSWP